MTNEALHDSVSPDGPRIAVIIPTYNRADRVSAAIRSVLEQSVASLRVIVVDDGSTDGTARVLEAFEGDPRVAVVRHTTNRGANCAKNTGLDQLQGGDAFFGILDSDDRLLPGALTSLTKPLMDEPGFFSMALGWCQAVPGGDPTGQMMHRSGSVTYEDALSGAFAGEFWQICRTDLIGGRRFDPRAMGGESSVWWALLRVAPGRLIPDVVRLYDVSGSDRISRIHNTKRDAHGRLFACVATASTVGADMRQLYPERYASMQTEIAKWGTLAGEHRIAFAAAREAARTSLGVRAVAVAAFTLVPSRLGRWVMGLRARIRPSRN
jgi:glycosyltransferase involved in cell wall biosynthesis